MVNESLCNDWEQRKLGELGEIITGNTPKTSETENYNEYGIPWITPTDIHSSYTQTSSRRLSDIGEKKAKLAPANSLLITCIASIGKNTLVQQRSAFNQQINALIPINNDPSFLLAASYNWSKRMINLAGQTSMQIVNKNTFSRISTKIPSLSEQQVIGAFFAKLINLTTLQQRKLELLKQLKKGFLQKLFADEDEKQPVLRFEGFTGDWEQRKLGEVTSFTNGRAYKQSELLEKGKYPVLRVGNFYTNDDWYYSNLELPAEKYANKGDLLYTWSATFGPHIWDGNKVVYHYHIWKVNINRNITKNFLYQFLIEDRDNLLNNTNGSTMIHITKKNMESKNIYLPIIDEQRLVGNFLKKLDNFITLQQSKLDKLFLLKRFLLQQMFI